MLCGVQVARRCLREGSHSSFLSSSGASRTKMQTLSTACDWILWGMLGSNLRTTFYRCSNQGCLTQPFCGQHQSSQQHFCYHFPRQLSEAQTKDKHLQRQGALREQLWRNPTCEGQQAGAAKAHGGAGNSEPAGGSMTPVEQGQSSLRRSAGWCSE